MFRAVRYLFQPAEKIPFTSTISASQNNEICPAFRILDEKGCPLSDSRPKCLNLDLARRMMQAMIKQQVLDSIMPEAQRQGRISFYMTSIGEEAACVGSAAVLNSDDVILAQYREAPALLFRGLTLNEFIGQCLGSQDDRGKGRNMPMHFGSPKLAFHTISSPLCTQLPHAAGIGYSFRVSQQPLVCMCYFGEGAASEGDFHAALNMSATLRSRTIFFCRNNGYAISTPASEQYKGDGISSRGAGYGIPSFRVDGTDTLAVMYITELAREIALRDNTPVLIEAMCYRGGHHSTSDDSTRYRSQREITDKSVDSVSKFARFLESEKWWENAETATYKSSFRSEVLATLSRQEKLPKIHPTELLDDVYDKLPVHLQNQKQELLSHLTKYYK